METARADRHIVPISGGKDSTATALWLAENEPRDYDYVCTPTGNELPSWYEHMRSLGALLGKPILPVIGGTLKGIIEQEQMIPNWRARFCTRMLKIDPFAAWLMGRTPATVYVGLRADTAQGQRHDRENPAPAIPAHRGGIPARSADMSKQTIGPHELQLRALRKANAARVAKKVPPKLKAKPPRSSRRSAPAESPG